MLKIMKNIKRCCKRLLVLLPILFAAGLIAYFARQRTEPVREPDRETVRTLRVIDAPVVDAVPAVTGYGVAEPGRIWDAVAQVKGTVSIVHPRLRSGELIEKGQILIEINPEEYELAVNRLQSGVEEIEAKMGELGETERYTKKLIEQERRLLELARNAYERKRTLLARDVISEEEKEHEERNFLQQKGKVTQLEETLASIQPRRRELDAALEGRRAELKRSRIDLGKTTIKTPFHGRLGEVKIEPGQFVGAGQSLFSFYGTDTVEVEARFQPEQLRPLVSKERRSEFHDGLSAGAFERLLGDVGVQVSQRSGDWEMQWEGRIDGIRGEMDPKTRDLKVILVIERPYEKAVPGVRPPLMPGAFCRVRLNGRNRPESVVVPRSALHEGNTVYILDGDSRLQTREVEIDIRLPDYIVIAAGLSGGETVVVSDPAPAIEGAKISPVEDNSARQHLLAVSRGGEHQ